MLPTQPYLRGNRLLGALPPDEWAALSPHLELVNLRSGQILCGVGQRLCHVHFPTTAIVSVLSTLPSDQSMEVATIGREGMTGLSLVTGGEVASTSVVVQSPGYAYRIAAPKFRLTLARSDFMQRLFLLYMHAHLMQVAQIAVCSRHHTLNKQLCRWLLVAADGSGSSELTATQQRIANMLGMRREGVTEAIGKLHDDGVISHTRGHITVLDRAALESRACGCYGAVKSAFERVLPGLHQEKCPAIID